MIIKAITIENFKGIREPVRVEFKPITLLFGPNSAGKSTIVQALHYAHEIFERNNPDPGKTIVGGEAVDLGGFQSMVYDHDLSKPISLQFDINIPDQDLPSYQTAFGTTFNERMDVFYYSARVKSAWVKIKVKWVNQRNAPYVFFYEIGIDGEVFARIESSEDVRQVSFSFINRNHKTFLDAEGTEDNAEFNFLSALIDNIVAKSYQASLNFSLDYQSALPIWNRHLIFDELESAPWSHNAFEESEKDALLLKSQFVLLMSSLVVGPGELIRDALREFRYLGPLRNVPTRNFEPALSPENSRWSDGLASWDTLYKSDEAFIHHINNWLSGENRLNAGYRIRLKRYKELDVYGITHSSISMGYILDKEELAREELEKLPVRTKLYLIEDNNGLEVLPQDVGIGISQVIPVIVVALHSNSGIVAIEQPELHIHPAFQVALGDLFISQVKEQDVCFLLETHSEHLLLRMLRRIRETHEDDLPVDAPAFSPDLLAVNFVEQTGNGVSITALKVDESGEFTNKWPRGFFPERAKELF